ncbi:MAG TPA: hypothetical protein VK961_09490 [Chthoniobacter sp.]|nr:hypothetical protein [Chthoniobacter sp.]
MQRTFLASLLLGWLSIPVLAINYTLESPSPDGRFALRLDPLGVDDSSEMEAAIVERATNVTLAKLPATLLGNYSRCQLLWTADSRRVAYTGGEKPVSRTQVFFRSGKSFKEIKLPTLPRPAFQSHHRKKSGPALTLYSDIVTPVRWLKSGSLLLSRNMEMKQESNMHEGKVMITIAFPAHRRAVIRKVQRSEITVDLY